MKIIASSPITLWQKDGETMEIVKDFNFVGSKITEDGDCNHDIERRLSLGRKAMTHLVQFSSVVQSCLTLVFSFFFFFPTLWDSMDYSMPGFPVHHQLPEFIQTCVHWISDAIQPSHPLSSPSPPTFNLFQHQSLFKWVSSSHQVANVLEFQLQHQSFEWTIRTDLL